MLYKINGLHFTGGDIALWKTNSSTGERTFSYFMNQAKKILNLAIDNFSIWGIFPGLDPYILDHYNQANIIY